MLCSNLRIKFLIRSLAISGIYIDREKEKEKEKEKVKEKEKEKEKE